MMTPKIIIYSWTCLIFLTTLLTAATASEVESNRCTEADEQYAEWLGGWYDPARAYQFGLEIQDIVRSRDTGALFELVRDELQSGPRRDFATSRSFDEIFPADWVASVLEDTPPCGPLGYNGFMLGTGAIWYTIEGETGEIISINGAAEKSSKEDVTWTFDGRVVSPQCFTYPWNSGDNFEAIAEYFHINTIDDFIANPGGYLGKPVDDINPIRPPWCDETDCPDEYLSIAKPIAACYDRGLELRITDDVVRTKIKDEYGDTCDVSYSVAASITTKQCKALAENTDAICRQGAMVRLQSTCNTGVKVKTVIGLYGIFDFDTGLYMAPLKFFDSSNQGLNFLDARQSEPQ